MKMLLDYLIEQNFLQGDALLSPNELESQNAEGKIIVIIMCYDSTGPVLIGSFVSCTCVVMSTFFWN